MDRKFKIQYIGPDEKLFERIIFGREISFLKDWLVIYGNDRIEVKFAIPTVGIYTVEELK